MDSLENSLKSMKNMNYRKIKIINSQKYLLEYIALGATTKEISQELGISENTAKSRIKTLFKKLNVQTREELIMKAIQSNLIDTKK